MSIDSHSIYAPREIIKDSTKKDMYELLCHFESLMSPWKCLIASSEFPLSLLRINATTLQFSQNKFPISGPWDNPETGIWILYTKSYNTWTWENAARDIPYRKIHKMRRRARWGGEELYKHRRNRRWSLHVRIDYKKCTKM